jgi:hypothetical protein
MLILLCVLCTSGLAMVKERILLLNKSGDIKNQLVFVTDNICVTQRALKQLHVLASN